MTGAALVTGGAGFVAGHLIPALLEKGWRVRACGRRPRPAWLPADADYRIADLAGGEPPHDLFDGIGHLFHLAGATSSLSSEDEMHASNVTATENLLAAGFEAGLERVLYMSSTSIYGEQVQLPVPVSEDAEPHPSRGYGKAKWLAEQAVWRLAQKGLPVVVVRPVSMYGPGAIKLLASAVLDAAIERFARRRSFAVHAEPIEQRLVHVADVVAACLHLIRHPGGAGRAFNLCLPAYPTNHELAGILAEQFGLELALDPDPDCGASYEERAGARERMLAEGMRTDIVFTKERLRFMRKANRNNRLSMEALAATGFEFGESDLQNGIARTIDWYRSHRRVL